jgi:dipeptidyl aminopeptidase/acylaminoacyl peptidase
MSRSRITQERKSRVRAAAGLSLALLAAVAACTRSGAPRDATPAAPPPVVASDAPATPATHDETRQLSDGVRVREVVFARAGVPMTAWIYRQAAAPRPQPVVVIAAAGTPLFWGMNLADGDRPEHLPWARAGYAVVAYSIDGAVDDPDSESAAVAGVTAFADAHAGRDNASAALSFALEHEPGLDATRVLAVGHSSAATLALRFGAEDARVRGVVAFNAVTDVPAYIGPRMMNGIAEALPAAAVAIQDSSPSKHAAALRAKPVLVFHAEDDTSVPIAESERLFAQLSGGHPGTRFERVASGGHYDSMLEQGIPIAVAWANRLFGR